MYAVLELQTVTIKTDATKRAEKNVVNNNIEKKNKNEKNTNKNKRKKK